MTKYIIPLNPVTKKNSQRIVTVGGYPKILPSKAYIQYQHDSMIFFKRIPPIDYPVNLKCLYYMQTRRKVDLVNLLEATCDLLVTFGVLKDDNSSIVVSHDGSRVFYDKQSPRTEIYLEEIADESIGNNGERIV